jgi:hypothetical protein
MVRTEKVVKVVKVEKVVKIMKAARTVLSFGRKDPTCNWGTLLTCLVMGHAC